MSETLAEFCGRKPFIPFLDKIALLSKKIKNILIYSIFLKKKTLNLWNLSAVIEIYPNCF